MSGNVKIKAFTSYFFDKSSDVAMCKFAYTATNGIVYSGLTNVIEFDAEGVICYLTPAIRISSELFNLGGQVQMSVSSNGEDFSNSLPLTYLLNITITEVYPQYVPVNSSQPSVVTINGTNFIDVSDTGLLSVRLTRILLSRQNVTSR